MEATSTAKSTYQYITDKIGRCEAITPITAAIATELTTGLS